MRLLVHEGQILNKHIGFTGVDYFVDPFVDGCPQGWGRHCVHEAWNKNYDQRFATYLYEGITSAEMARYAHAHNAKSNSFIDSF